MNDEIEIKLTENRTASVKCRKYRDYWAIHNTMTQSGIDNDSFTLTHIPSGAKVCILWTQKGAEKVVDFIVDEIGISGDFKKTSGLHKTKYDFLKRLFDGLACVETCADWDLLKLRLMGEL